MGRLSVCRITERLDIRNLEFYAAAGTDRRQALLQVYLRRVRASSGDEFPAAIDVEYYKLPHYGRLMARGVAGQKLTKEARFAAFSTICVELDAPCCHPRLLHHKLQTCGLLDNDQFPMLMSFVANFAAWRQAIARYADVGPDEAKVEIIRIFYGGRPSLELPFLLKLAAEVQKAATMLMRQTLATPWQQLYGDRRNPEFSRLSAMLSYEENELLNSVRNVVGDRLNVMLYDGAYVHCPDLESEILVVEACRLCTDTLVPMKIKTWPRSTWTGTFMRYALRRDQLQWKSSQEVVTSYGCCLLNAIASMERDCDLSGLRDHTGPMSAKDFNDAMIFSSQRPTYSNYRLTHADIGDVSAWVGSGEQWLCHQQLDQDVGHWIAVVFDDEERVTIYDSTAGPRRLWILPEDFEVLRSEQQNLTWFQFAVALHDDEPEDAVAYNLLGSVGNSTRSEENIQRIVSPCSTCLSCGASLCERKPALDAFVYGMSGLRRVYHVRMRCTSKSCRSQHYYNFRLVGGQKMNSMIFSDAKYIFITATTGFDVDFLCYHDALQFRGYLSIRAIAWAQKGFIWPEDHDHARFRLDYSHARLLCTVMQECESMWGVLPRRTRFSRHMSIVIDDPLSSRLLQEYDTWWHEQAIPDMLTQTVSTVAMDGHEKIATRCYDAPPSRGGRPRKDGHIKLSHNGWFMITDPDTGIILAVSEMREPENNDLALRTLCRATAVHTRIDCVVYDRACSLLSSAQRMEDLNQIRYWAVDKFHAKGHCDSCKCSPYNHPRLSRRLSNVNTSISEQIFSWFRGYANTMNTMNARTHRFYVLVYSKRHNELVIQNEAFHLNPHSAHKKTMKKAKVHARPASSAYACKKPAGKVMKIMKKPSSRSK